MELEPRGFESAHPVSPAGAGKRSGLRPLILTLTFAAATIVSGCEPNLHNTAAPDEQGYVVSDIVLNTANE